jgi:hypothetical protein
VRYHRSHIHRLVRALGLTPQRPRRLAVERDEAAIACWVAEDWAAIKQTVSAQVSGAWICFADESGVTLSLPVRRTWAPRGQTPILRHPARRGESLSMSAILCYRPDASQARLVFGLRQGAWDTPSLIRQLDLLGAHLAGKPAILVWDNLNVHKSHDMRAFVAAQPWLEVAYLPAYAPELNPVEYLWDARIDRQVAWRAWKSARMAW